MQTVGVKVLKNKLSEYLHRAATGETIQVTDRNRVIAEINPPRSASGLTPFEEQGVREGWLRPARNPNTPLPPRQPLVSFDELMRELEQDREDP
jgi:antitoxin (DNA-binding transcriptional repressor) of toxin-antitoxin stability system